MVRVLIDGGKCNGHGLCELAGAGVFEVNPGNGFNDAGEFEVSEELRATAVNGAMACPERAITVSD